MEPEGELGLAGHRAIDKAMPGPDADHSAPAAHADERSQAQLAPGVGEDVAVAAAVLVGEGDHGPARCLERVGDGGADARDVVAEPAAGQLLDEEARDAAAAVEAGVDDEALAVVLEQEASVELAEALGPHVRDVDVAEAAAAGLTDVAAVVCDPLPIACRPLGAQGPDGHRARRLVAASDGQLHLVARERRQQRGHGACVRHGLAVHGEDPVSGPHANARLGQWRAPPRVPAVANHDALHGGIGGEVRGEEARAVVGRAAVVAAELVGVAGAELALHRPDEVAELRSGADACHEWRVALPGGGPVRAAHVRGPVVVAHEPPDLADHLRPLVGRVDLDGEAAQVEPAGLAGGLRALGLLVLGARELVAYDPQATAATHEEGLAVARDVEARDAGHHSLVFELVEVIAAQRAVGGGLGVGPAAGHGAAQRIGRVQHAAVAGAADRAEATRAQGEGQDALLDAVEVDARRRRGRGRGARLRLLGSVGPWGPVPGVARGTVPGTVLGVQGAGHGPERGGEIVAEGEQAQPRVHGEAEVGAMLIEDGRVVAIGDEVEVAAVRVERGHDVHELGARDGDGLAALGYVRDVQADALGAVGHPVREEAAAG